MDPIIKFLAEDRVSNDESKANKWLRACVYPESENRPARGPGRRRARAVSLPPWTGYCVQNSNQALLFQITMTKPELMYPEAAALNSTRPTGSGESSQRFARAQ